MPKAKFGSWYWATMSSPPDKVANTAKHQLVGTQGAIKSRVWNHVVLYFLHQRSMATIYAQGSHHESSCLLSRLGTAKVDSQETDQNHKRRHNLHGHLQQHPVRRKRFRSDTISEVQPSRCLDDDEWQGPKQIKRPINTSVHTNGLVMGPATRPLGRYWVGQAFLLLSILFCTDF